jgi:V/A-type H+-transporting ATPase subunit I
MALRPVPIIWFEALVTRDEAVLAMEALAATGAVEIELPTESAGPILMSDLAAGLEEYRALARHYEPYWPKNQMQPSALPGPPQQTLARALGRVRGWKAEAEPLIARLRALEEAVADLPLWQELMAAAGKTLDIGALSRTGPALRAQVFLWPRDAAGLAPEGEVVSRRVETKKHVFLVTLGTPPALESAAEQGHRAHGRVLPWPDWMTTGQVSDAEGLEGLRRALAEQAASLRAVLAGLQDKHRLGEALGDIVRLQWFMDHASPSCVSERACWIAGWTSDIKGAQLSAALRQAGVHAVLRLVSPSENMEVPTMLRNPSWVRPFELFLDLAGVPAAHEADPTAVLAITVPLLFGYMFPDLGHGFVLLLIGPLFEKRWRHARLLADCGVAAMAFGVLFGGLFGLEDAFEPLWLNPLKAPATVMVVPLFAGAGLLLLGLALGGLEAYWRGEWRAWVAMDAGVLVLYMGGLVSFWYPPAAGVAVAGLLWNLGGTLLFCEGSCLKTVAAAFGRLLEGTLRLVVNTLSFVRVGAFALAHAALALVLVELARLAGHPVGEVLVLALGNALLIALEGFLVSVQTARLVLFEFFGRFLKAEGRVFKPLAAPTPLPKG